MNKQLKNIIEKVIEMKESEIQEHNFEGMTEEERSEYEELNNKFIELENEFKKSLGVEQQQLLNKCFDARSDISTIEQHYMFKKGVKIGLTDLHFIKEELGSGTVLL